MNLEQGEIDFTADNPEDGYKNWQQELKKQQRKIESQWGIILGKKVRLHLRDYDQPFEGIMSIDKQAPKPKQARHPLRLRIGHHTFQAGEIKSISTITEN